MLNQRNREPNFLEKKRQWKSKMEKPLSRRMLMMMLPAVILSVFVIMSAPYLKLIMEQFLEDGDMMSAPMELNLKEEKVVEKKGPPPNPDAVIREDYRRKLEAEGFDWRKKPEIEGPDLGFAKEQEHPIEPIDVELPNTMTELQAQSKPAETPSK
ncbi:hypothetical protein [Pelagicoccus mobilis]|uniref:Uncharacterized protein n=1 Tax=Pelagicoccus mobilis TaxID=415221 RepID=A0A934RZ16_9BACT|nr:hypothetical protein [Pelagicoccus mobilis]MBK1879221.1 hypothetical protein [Pelagicoccus mobilis]